MSDARVVLPVRVEKDRPALVDQAAAQLGVTRAEWLRRLVDRGLKGQGLLVIESPRSGGKQAALKAAQKERARSSTVEPRFKR